MHSQGFPSKKVRTPHPHSHICFQGDSIYAIQIQRIDFCIWALVRPTGTPDAQQFMPSQQQKFSAELPQNDINVTTTFTFWPYEISGKRLTSTSSSTGRVGSSLARRYRPGTLSSSKNTFQDLRQHFSVPLKSIHWQLTFWSLPRSF